MNVYTIVLERIGTGKLSLSLITRQDNEEAARGYAEAAIAQSSDLPVVDIQSPPDDFSPTRPRAAWRGSDNRPR